MNEQVKDIEHTITALSYCANLLLERFRAAGLDAVISREDNCTIKHFLTSPARLPMNASISNDRLTVLMKRFAFVKGRRQQLIKLRRDLIDDQEQQRHDLYGR